MNKNLKNVAAVHTHTHTHTHTGNLTNNKIKKEERDICINASNCDAEKTKSNNIVTYEKFKSDVVGADASVRPQTKTKYKNKLTSNIRTSNIKPLTSNSAITLVALVINIIVLLILTGVTLNMVIGENGIINKAQIAKNKTNEAQEEDNLKKLENSLNEIYRGDTNANTTMKILYSGGEDVDEFTLSDSIDNYDLLEITMKAKGERGGNIYFGVNSSKVTKEELQSGIQLSCMHRDGQGDEASNSFIETCLVKVNNNTNVNIKNYWRFYAYSSLASAVSSKSYLWCSMVIGYKFK